MRRFVLASLVILAAGAAAAVEVPFGDGSVIEAAGYTVTGSYIMLEMANGSRVAYDIADVDLDALRRAEAEAAAAAAPEAAAPAIPTTLGVTRSLQVPDGSHADATGGLTITDQHVKHVSGSGIGGPEDETEQEAGAADALPEGYQEGGGVLLNNVSVSPIEGGEWQVQGEVINRTADSVLDVRANLQAAVPDGPPWTASVPVSGIMGPDEKATFNHTFAPPAGTDDSWSPQVQVSVVWMQSESRLEPNYNRTAPHPSALPYDRGGVGGAEIRNDEVID